MSHQGYDRSYDDSLFHQAPLTEVAQAGSYGTIWELRALNPNITSNTYIGRLRCFGLVTDRANDFTVLRVTEQFASPGQS